MEQDVMGERRAVSLRGEVLEKIGKDALEVMR